MQHGKLRSQANSVSGMPLADFDRYPLTFGPSPVHPLPRLTAAPRGRRDLGQA